MKPATALAFLMLFTIPSFANPTNYHSPTILETTAGQTIDDPILDYAEQMPMFPGGEAALLQWISSHIQYSKGCEENGVQGRVVVQFVVKKDGSVGRVEVIRSIHPDLDKEAIRVVKTLPAFVPGKQNGIPVNVWYVIPITFKIYRGDVTQNGSYQDLYSEEILNEQAVTELEILPPDEVTSPPAPVYEWMADDRAVGSVDQTGGSDNIDDIITAKTHETRVQADIPMPERQKAGEKVFAHVDLMPTFPGGEMALLQWVSAHIQYPKRCKDDNIQGRVVVQFVVKKDGSIGQVKVVRPKDPDLDAEAVRVVKSLPAFTPGMENGNPVDVWYTLPITFKLPQ